MKYDRLNHRLGKMSAYDADMDLIEDFVECYHCPPDHPNRKMIHYGLNLYYINRALHYWSALIKYLQSDDIYRGHSRYSPDLIHLASTYSKQRNEERKRVYKNQFLKYVDHFSHEKENQNQFPLPDDYITPIEISMGRKLNEAELDYLNLESEDIIEYIFKHLKQYKAWFYQLLAEVEQDMFVFDNAKIGRIFKYIAFIHCLDPQTLQSEKLKCYYKSNVFPFVTSNGQFSFNTWLYSYFSGLILVGFSDAIAYYDNFKGCSLTMSEHDLQHHQTIDLSNIEKYPIFGEAKFLYYSILHFLEAELLEKELCILVLWIAIHERPFFAQSFEEDRAFKLYDIIIFSSDAIEIVKEFKKYASLFDGAWMQSFLYQTENNKNSIFENIRQGIMNEKEYCVLGIYYAIEKFRIILNEVK